MAPATQSPPAQLLVCTDEETRRTARPRPGSGPVEQRAGFALPAEQGIQHGGLVSLHCPRIWLDFGVVTVAGERGAFLLAYPRPHSSRGGLEVLLCGGDDGALRACKHRSTRRAPRILAQDQKAAPCFTESQNVQGWKGPLWVTQSNPPAKAGSPRAGCTGPCPGAS